MFTGVRDVDPWPYSLLLVKEQIATLLSKFAQVTPAEPQDRTPPDRGVADL